MLMKYLDVNSKTPGYREIELACKMGIISGMPDGTFRPYGHLTVAQLCKIFAYAMNMCIEPPPTPHPNGEYKHWAWHYYNFCEKNNVISGLSTEDLDRPATWGILSKMINRYHRNNGTINDHFSYDIDYNRNLRRFEICVVCVQALIDSMQECFVIIEHFFSNRNFKGVLHSIQRLGRYVYLFPEYLQQYRNVVEYFPDLQNIQEEMLEYIWDVNQIFEKYFSIGTKIDKVYHYTNLFTLEKLTKGSKLRLSNSITLNDPMEGVAFYDMIGQHSKPPFFDRILAKLISEQNNKPNFYIVSLTATPNETIPMWFQYSKEGTGCRIAFCTDSIRRKLFKVVYDYETIDSFIEEIANYTNIVLSNLELSDCTEFLEKLIHELLIKASFLYKDPSYAHEQEVRIVEYVEPQDAMEENYIRDGEFFPRVYAEIKEDLKIAGVLLGPKVSERTVEQVSLSLKVRGQKCIVEKSELKFR